MLLIGRRREKGGVGRRGGAEGEGEGEGEEVARRCRIASSELPGIMSRFAC